ncbi:MAG: type II toxin-antitoxin system VapC family toxin [Acidobacteriota bacterium]
MRLLLDTHTFLWFIMGNSKLSSSARTLIEDISNDKQLSIVSVWEMAIKVSIGKLSLAGPFEIIIPEQIKNNGFDVMNIDISHINIVATLPMHHRDPFDRLLIAQCMIEDLSIISADSAFDSYSVHRLW